MIDLLRGAIAFFISIAVIPGTLIVSCHLHGIYAWGLGFMAAALFSVALGLCARPEDNHA